MTPMGCGRIVGIVSPRRISRPAARMLGRTVQIDGSEHAWFEDAPACTLLAFVDDATSVMSCGSSPRKSAFDYFGDPAYLEGMAARSLLQRQARHLPV